MPVIGGVGTAVPFHNKIKSFQSSKVAKNISLSAVFKPETNWMNPRPLVGAICLTWSKISQIQLIQEHPNTHTPKAVFCQLQRHGMDCQMNT